MKITNIHAIEVLDSRGNPTVKGYVELENGVIGSASVPSGASTGTHEARELRDDNPSRYLGKGVLKAVEKVNNEIAGTLVGFDVSNLKEIDAKLLEMDGTENKATLGANAILPVSLACVRALALSQKQPVWKTINQYYFKEVTPGFPRLMVNIVNGGRHADWNFDIQEFMVIPKVDKPSESVRIAAEIFHHLGIILKANRYSILIGDEGGYSPSFTSNDEVFEYILEAISKAGFSPAAVDIGIDAAASEFFDKGVYSLRKQGGNMTVNELIEYYLSINKKYGVYSFEDPFHEDDWDGFKQFTSVMKDTALIIGDDLYVTNPKRIQRGISEQASNAAIIKVNQIGTMMETVEAIHLCKQNGLKVVISHRSGETEDPFIADLAVACGADFIKTGSMCRSDRIAKYNRLLEIEKLEMK